MQNKTTVKDSAAEAYKTALRFIKFRPRSSLEVRNKLRSKDFISSVIDETIRQLLNEGLLDDETFARAWALERLVNKGLGRIKIKNELRQKGISGEIIEDVLDKIAEEEEPAETAARFLKNKYRDRVDLIEEKDLISVLLRNGYSYSEAREAIRLIKEEED